MQDLSAHATQKEIAAVTGIEQTSISQWKRGLGTPKWQSVVAIARAYHRSPVEAFIAAGYITEDEAAQVVKLPTPASELSTEELLAELGRRTRGHRGDGGEDG